MSEETPLPPHSLEAVKKAIRTLSEHFDTVMIFTTLYDPKDNNTYHVELGCGNWYARHGHVSEWVENNLEDSREQRRKREDE